MEEPVDVNKGRQSIAGISEMERARGHVGTFKKKKSEKRKKRDERDEKEKLIKWC